MGYILGPDAILGIFATKLGLLHVISSTIQNMVTLVVLEVNNRLAQYWNVYAPVWNRYLVLCAIFIHICSLVI